MQVANRRVAAAGAAGVAGLAAALATVGTAHAAPAPSTGGSSAANGGGADATAPKQATPKKLAPTETTVAPDFGTRKIRVGVQIDPDADVPDGTNTVGSEITIVETGPSAPEGGSTTTCNTEASTVEPPSTASWCLFNLKSERSAKVPARAGVDPSQFENFYFAGPGDSVTITQTSVNPNLVIDSTPIPFGPCNEVDGFFCAEPAEALFTDEGFPPVAVDDTATTKPGVAVGINNLANDDLKGAHTGTITNLTQPEHGKAVIVNGAAQAGVTQNAARRAANTQSVKYTPDPGFVGVDPFHYTLTTANGSSTAKVTVTIVAPPTATPSSSAAGEPPLAATGNENEQEMLLALGLLAAGGTFTALGRRRRARGRHGV
jgi:LPXTG-motif cell wall-anchored protein